MDDTLDLVQALASIGSPSAKKNESSSEKLQSPGTPGNCLDSKQWDIPPSQRNLQKSAPPTPPGSLPLAGGLMSGSLKKSSSQLKSVGEYTRNQSQKQYAEHIKPLPHHSLASYSSDTPVDDVHEYDFTEQRRAAAPPIVNPFVDYGDEGDIVFITDSPERQKWTRNGQHDADEPAHRRENGRQPGGWWRNIRNRAGGQGSEDRQITQPDRDQTDDDESEGARRRVSLTTSVNSIRLDCSGELLEASGGHGDGSEMGMVKEDQPHLVVSLLQARNMIPPTSTGRAVQRFNAYFVVNYGGFERKTNAVLSPSGAALLDQHMIFPAIGAATDLVITLMSKGKLADKSIASLCVSVPPIFGRRASRSARSNLESLGGFGVVLESEEGAKLNSPLCHAEWFPLDSNIHNVAVLAEVNLSLTPTFFRQLPSLLELSRGHREDRCRVVREVEDLVTHCVATELMPSSSGQLSEPTMTSSAAAVAQEMKSLRLLIWKDIDHSLASKQPSDMFDVSLGASNTLSSGNHAPLEDVSSDELKRYLGVLLTRVRNHTQLTSSIQTHGKSSRSALASAQAQNNQLIEANKQQGDQLRRMGDRFQELNQYLAQMLEGAILGGAALEDAVMNSFASGGELWPVTVLVPDEESVRVVVKLTPENSVFQLMVLVNRQLKQDKVAAKVISVSLQGSEDSLSMQSTLRAAGLTADSTLVATLWDEDIVQVAVEGAEILEAVEYEHLPEVREESEGELSEAREEVARMQRELSTWLRAQQEWGVKEQELLKRLEATEKSKLESGSALAQVDAACVNCHVIPHIVFGQSRASIAKLEGLCSEFSERVAVAEAKAARAECALDALSIQLSTERSSANSTMASLERREMLSLVQAVSLNPNANQNNKERRQRELQRRVTVENPKQHQMSERMGMGPTLSPGTQKQLQQQYSCEQPFKEVEESGGEPETLKEYYEQKRKLRERQNRGKLEVGPDGLLIPREKRKGPLRLSKTEPTKVDWSGY